MTPKERALDLCQSFGYTTIFTDCNEGYTLPLEISKKCALIAVDEIILSHRLGSYFDEEKINSFKSTSDYFYIFTVILDYWQEVKQEIEKL